MRVVLPALLLGALLPWLHPGPLSAEPARRVVRAAPGWAPATGMDPAPPPADTVAGGEWDAPRVRAILRRATEARRHAYSDTALHSFTARAEGHVYYLARAGGPRSAGRTRLVRADQVALRVAWREPDRWIQTVVGRRQEERLPTGIRYHLDHLSLVMANFGRRIRIGEGTEVRDVLHPVAPGAADFYEFRLADSLEIRTARRTSRLYRILVRPESRDAAGVVGEIHLVRPSWAVARMRFTFTAGAYRDPDVESIEVDLRSALWRGRFWLPAEQSVTVRREMSWMSFPLASIIRTRFRVGDYRINPDTSLAVPPGGRVITLPEERLRAFDDWRLDLYEGPLGGAGRDPVGAGEVRRRARQIARSRFLGGRSRLTLHVPRASAALRVRRSEGLAVGAGAAYRLPGGRRVTARAAHPFEAGGLAWELGLRGALPGTPGPRLELRAFGARRVDAGPFTAASGAVGTAGFLLRGEDFVDDYVRSGVELVARVPLMGGRAGLGAGWETHREAPVAASPPGGGPVRPGLPATPGELGRLLLRWRGDLGGRASRWRLRLAAEGASGEVGDFGFTRALAFLEAAPRSPARLGWRLRAGLGAGGGDLPPQRLLRIGGRGTVPGYRFRAWGGDRAAWIRGEVTLDMLGPWLSIRGVGAAGWAALGAPAAPAARRTGVGGTGGIRPSLGAGIGVMDGLIRLDAVRGLNGGRWEWIVSVSPDYRDML